MASTNQATVTTEEEDNANLAVAGINEAIELDVDGNKIRRSQVSSDSEEEGDNEKLARMMKSWSSPIYAFFSPIPAIKYRGGRKTHTFTCLAKGCNKEIHRYLDTTDAQSTSNMRKHATKCWGNEVVQRQIVQVMHLHTKPETKAEIVRWVAESLRPFKVIADRGFLLLMKTGCPGYYVPSPSTVSRDVKLVFARSRKCIAKILQDYDGDLSFATDAWSSPNHHAFVAFTVHLLWNGELISILLDVVEVAKSHSGVNLAEAFIQVLQDFGVAEKLLGITCDNASPNDVMVEKMADLSMLSQFDVPKCDADRALSAAERELATLADDLEDDDLTAVDDEESNEVEGWVDERAGMTEAEREELRTEVAPVKLILVKLRKVAFKIVHSMMILLPAWKAILTDLGQRERLIPRDVATRWNSTYNMLVVALEYQVAICTIVANTTPELNEVEMTAQEWRIAQQLCDILHVLKDATMFFSRGTPNLATVIPAMDHIDSTLATSATDMSLNAAIRASLGITKRTLNRYYNLTDSSELYRIAMVLHPHHKLAYFQNVQWQEDWIETMRDMVHDEFKRSYASLEVPEDAEEDIEVIEGSLQSSGNIFDNRSALTASKSQDTPTSVAVEHVFSRGRLLLSHVRNCLSASTTRALLCLGDWSQLGLVQDSDVQHVASMSDVPPGEEQADGEFVLPNGWDAID
ncbi:hypothetical protein EVG20_g11174 [Dentipellis fragilis]|uniref:HAT C-terminal dimerisation domain-containing protein n=1 Tax=Dentipellis fragilis TaxID=205917 RepID=A0A4Y9XLY3_9AGAM|nr:hypothetical protein EVG20_g11174 [Dentipellis fragilis]